MKKFIIAFIILIFSGSAGIIYLNKVILPTRIKSLIIQQLGEATGKKVTLEKVEFSIFKGLVLRNLVLSDAAGEVISVKEVSSTFFILPIFKRMIVVPSVNLESAVIYLERKADNTFNLADLFTLLSKTKEGQAPKFKVFVYKITLKDSRIDFQDNTLSPAFSKSMDNLDLAFYLSLPASVKFNIKSRIPANPDIKIDGSGEFKIPEKELSAKISLKDISPGEFSVYYQNSGVSLPAGIIDALVNLALKNDSLSAEVNLENKNLVISKDKASVRLNSVVMASLRYNLTNRDFTYSGQAEVMQSDILGLEPLGSISGISGQLKFNNAGLTSDKLTANIMGMPVEAKLNLSDFKKPVVNLELASGLALGPLLKTLQENFGIALPAKIQGEARLLLKMNTPLPAVSLPQIDGSLEISQASAKIEKPALLLEKISGRIEFNEDGLKWPGLKFSYQDTLYQTSGSLADFQAPAVQLELHSPEISLESIFLFKDKLLTISKCDGKYFNSGFALAGRVNTADATNLETAIKGILDIDLQDMQYAFKKSTEQLVKIKPAGIVHSEFNLSGNIGDIKKCAIQAVFSSPSISAYGLKSGDFALNYNQADALGDIGLARLVFYGGIIEAAAKINLGSENLPYWIAANMQGVKLEELTQDTPAKEKGIAGTVTAEVKMNGFSNELSRLSGAGRISITEGKLWQLDLFKGMGVLIFSSDFANIVFHEASCTFVVEDKYISSDDVKLKSNFVELDGTARLGFDASIDAEVGVEVLSEMAPISGTLKDLATVALSRAGKMGVIRISGTLKEPKYKFTPVVINIIKGLKDTLGGIFSKE